MSKDITIVIAMYNAESTIDLTLRSIYPKELVNSRLEVIVVDDGSTDSSRQIVEKWQRKLFTNISLIDGGHKGVSHARNVAINAAQGRYITFMDSDDRFSNNNFDGIVKFFDSVYEKTDIVTYPLVYVNTYTEEDIEKFGFPLNQTRLDVSIDPVTHSAIYTKKLLAAKQKLFNKGTAVYDTESVFWLGQKTVNVVIKNLRFVENASQIYFEEDVPNGEDSMFMTRYVEHSNSIGYYNRGNFQYLYYRRGDSTVQKFLSPVDSYEMVMMWAERLIHLTKDNDGNISKYVQAIILDEFGWRIKSTNFFPKHLDEDTYNQWLDRLKNVLLYISVDVLKRGMKPNPTMPRFVLNMLIELRGEVRYVADAAGISFFQNDELILRETHFETILSGIEFEDNRLTINATAKHYFSHLFTATPFYEIDGVRVPFSKTYESTESYFMQKHKTHNFMGFKDSIDLTKKNAGTIKIGYEVDGFYYYPDLMFIRNSRLFADKMGMNVAYVEGVRFSIDYDRFVITFARNISEQAKYQLQLGYADNQGNEILNEISEVQYETNDIVWLYTDTIGKIDNAYTQFLHDIDKNDGIVRKYIVHEGYEQYITDLRHEKHFVLFGSEEHKRLFLNSNTLVAAFQGIDTFSPYPKNVINQIRGILNLNVVYLQHGLLHAKIEHIYSSEKVDFYRKWVVSSQMEFDELVNNYHLDSSQIIRSGMPRFFGRKREIKQRKLKKVLYAPSWRRNLMMGQSYKGSGWQPNEGLLKKSIIMENIRKLFNDEKLSQWLKEQDISIDVKLHPIMANFSDFNNQTNGNVQLINDIADMSEYDLFITDYSSFMYDAVADNVPILLFQPDLDYFIDGIHTFIDYVTPANRTLADSVYSFDELVETLKRMEADSLNLNKHLDDYEDFLQVSVNPMETIYEEVKKAAFPKAIVHLDKNIIQTDHFESFITELEQQQKLNFDGNLMEIETKKSIAVYSSATLNPKTKLKIRLSAGTRILVYGTTNADGQLVLISKFGFISGSNFWVRYNSLNEKKSSNGFKKITRKLLKSVKSSVGKSNDVSKTNEHSVQELDERINSLLKNKSLPTFVVQSSGDLYQKVNILNVRWDSAGRVNLVTENNTPLNIIDTKIIVPRQDVEKYVIDIASGDVFIALEKLNVYSSTKFKRYTRKTIRIEKGTKLDVKAVEWTKGGTPRLKIREGYVSASQAFVSKNAK